MSGSKSVTFKRDVDRVVPQGGRDQDEENDAYDDDDQQTTQDDQSSDKGWEQQQQQQQQQPLHDSGDDENVDPVPPFDLEGLNPAVSMHLHNLRSFKVGQSQVEKLVDKIEKRKRERVPITFSVRVRFLETCRTIAINKGYEKQTRIHLLDLLEFRERVKKECKNYNLYKEKDSVRAYLRIINDSCCLLEVLDKAVEIVKEVQLQENDHFYYQDFNYMHTVLVSRWPWKRHRLLAAGLTIFQFYFWSPILFCAIMNDKGVCPRDGAVPGVVNALYFASVTMSTVGYGDLSVEKDQPWKVLIGTLYMIVAMYVAITAFSAAAESALSPFRRFLDRHTGWQFHKLEAFEKGDYLYKRVNKLRRIRYAEIIVQFLALNLIYVLASRFFLLDDEEFINWDWMHSFYVAVQTTTTIGYGGEVMPEKIRYFQIFYLTLSTYLAGNALGKLGRVHSDIEHLRRYHAWQRRDVNKHLIHYLASTDDPTRVDQFEFVVASLLDLGKVSKRDIAPIMEKYRSLAEESGRSGYIEVCRVPEEQQIDFTSLKEKEGAEGT